MGRPRQTTSRANGPSSSVSCARCSPPAASLPSSPTSSSSTSSSASVISSTAQIRGRSSSPHDLFNQRRRAASFSSPRPRTRCTRSPTRRHRDDHYADFVRTLRFLERSNGGDSSLEHAPPRVPQGVALGRRARNGGAASHVAGRSGSPSSPRYGSDRAPGLDAGSERHARREASGVRRASGA